MGVHKRINPGDTVPIELTKRQHQLIIEKIRLWPELETKLRFGVLDGEGLLTFELKLDELEELVEYVAAEANRAPNKKLEAEFDELYDRIVAVLKAYTDRDEYGEEGLSDLDILPPPLREGVVRLIQEHDFQSLEEANEQLERLSMEYNKRPDAELGGLSPLQVRRLIYGDWGSSGSAVRLEEQLPFAQLQAAPILLNARVMFEALVESDGTKATAAGNLNRKFVLQMVESMHLPSWFVNMLRRFHKVLNESDVLPLHTLRIVLEIARLIRRSKGSFRVTRKGKSFMPEAAAGALYALLFRTYFREFNLAYMDRMLECPAVQGTIAFSLFILGQEAEDWRSLDELIPMLFLPAVKAEFPADRLDDYDKWIATSRILRPLQRFGLVEFESLEEEGGFYQVLKRVRKTELFDRFLSFDLATW